MCGVFEWLKEYLITAAAVLALMALGGCGGGRSGTNAGTFTTVVKFSQDGQALAGVEIAGQTSDQLGEVAIEATEEELKYLAEFQGIEQRLNFGNRSDFGDAQGIYAEVSFRPETGFQILSIDPVGGSIQQESAADPVVEEPPVGKPEQKRPSTGGELTVEQKQDNEAPQPPVVSPDADPTPPPTLAAETWDATGHVVSSSGLPISSARVTSADGTLQTLTDANGHFSLKNVPLRFDRAGRGVLKLIVTLGSGQRFHLMELLEINNAKNLLADVTCRVSEDRLSFESNFFVQSRNGIAKDPEEIGESSETPVGGDNEHPTQGAPSEQPRQPDSSSEDPALPPTPIGSGSGFGGSIGEI